MIRYFWSRPDPAAGSRLAEGAFVSDHESSTAESITDPVRPVEQGADLSPEPSAEPTAEQSQISSRLRKHQGEGVRRLADRFAGPIDAFHIMTEADVEKANAALERFIESDSVEQEILEELLDSRPLAEPDAFVVLHRTFIRSLEVYDRNARRAPSRLPFGFLKPVISPLVTLLTVAMSNWYQKRLVRDVRRLYVLREANSQIGSFEHRRLGSARRQLDALSPDLARGFSIPAFLVGGAVLSTVASILQNLLHSNIGRFALLAAILLVTVWVFTCLLTAAAVTRRRTRLVLDQPMTLLWKSIGSAGRPPREPSRAFVAVATLLLLVGWIVAPLAAAVIYSIT